MSIMSWPSVVALVVLWALSWVCGRSYFHGLSSAWLLVISIVSGLVAAHITAEHADDLFPWVLILLWIWGRGL